ncbi:MAG: class I SAM-dependent methyltransferase [Pseudonocardiaceae bacterium]
MTTATQAWERYAEKARPRRETNAAGAATWLNWTQYPDHGPDEAVLGEVRGRTVLELGSGAGSNLAHLATLGAHCTGVDLAPSRAPAAQHSWGHLTNLDFVTADVVDYLTATSATFDVVYSIFGAVWFIDPGILLPLVGNRMTPGGVFAFSHLPARTPATRSDRVITKWDHPAEHWVRSLNAQGFADATAEIIPAPTTDQPGTLLVRALAPA